MTTTESCRVDCVGTLDGVAALAAEWAELEGATPEATGFQSFVWCHTWLRLAGARVTPRIVCVREAGRLVLLAPLQIERRFGVAIALGRRADDAIRRRARAARREARPLAGAG